MYQFIIENILLEHTFHSRIPLRWKTVGIMLFQRLADMGIHWKGRKLVKGHKADAVRHFHADAVKLQEAPPGPPGRSFSGLQRDLLHRMPPEGPCPGHILPGTPGCSPEAPLPWPDLRLPPSETHNKRSRPRLFFPRRIFLRSGRCISACGQCCSAGRSETRRSFPKGPRFRIRMPLPSSAAVFKRRLPGQSLLYKCHSLFPGQNSVSRTSRTLPRWQSKRTVSPSWVALRYLSSARI